MPGQVQPKMDAWLHKKRKLEQILGVHRHDKCVEQGCEKFCRSKSDKCKAHGGGKRCVVEGCRKSARGKTDKCKGHGGGKRCVVEGCGKSARDNTDKCVEHGGGKRCVVEGCGKSAQGNTDKCIEHGGGKRCVVEGCGKGAQGKTDKCIAHGGGLRCPHCITWPDSRMGNPDYDNFCATCFKFLFPNDPRTKAYGFKETQTKAFIDKHFQNFRHNKCIETAHPCDCTKRRFIDHRRCIGNTMICVETDERAHTGYSVQDERDRYHDVIMDWGGKLVFIRFNPDGKGFSMDEKHARLAAEINEQVRRVEAGENTELCERVYLFYPTKSRLIAAQ